MKRDIEIVKEKLNQLRNFKAFHFGTAKDKEFTAALAKVLANAERYEFLRDKHEDVENQIGICRTVNFQWEYFHPELHGSLDEVIDDLRKQQ